MDKSMFEKYIKEMKEMQTKANPTLKEKQNQTETVQTQSYVNPAENDDNMTGSGSLIVNATAVRGLYPVENAKVTIFTGNAVDMKIIAETFTDISGKTPIIKLPAPSSVYTDAPDPSNRPYAFYNVRTAADGYIPTDNYNVAVFDNITSIQNVSLFPVISTPETNQPIIIDEYENYDL